MATLAVTGGSAATRTVEATDHDLVEAVRSGDDRAFEQLYGRYHRRISAYIFGMVHDHGRAEDLTQEVFMSALRRMRQTDRPIAFKPWVYEIAKNACIDAFRRSRRTEEVSYDAEEGLGASDYGRLVTTGPSPDAAVDTKQKLDHLCGAFGGLSEAHHQILVMRELEGLSYREIGERLGMSRPSVESTLFRARRRLTEEYDELVTGERCLRVQAIIAGAEQGALGLRDQRRVGRHISHCRPCRRQACMAGLDAAVMAQRPVRAKIAALLPLPGFLRRRWLPSEDSAAAASAAHQHGSAFAQFSMAASQYGEPAMAGWMKAAAVATAVAVTGAGAGAVQHHRASSTDSTPTQRLVPAAAAAPAATSATAQSTPRRATAKVSGASGSTGQVPGGTSSTGSKPHGGAAAQGTSGDANGPAGAGTEAPANSVAAAPGAATGATPAAGTGTTVPHRLPGTGSGGSSGSGSPLVQPDVSAIAPSAPAAATTPAAGDVVQGVTDAAGSAVGGSAGQVVQDAGGAVSGAVDDATEAAGSVLTGK